MHGGGFYHMVKYLVAPAQMPESLTWFKWEAYATWLSGHGPADRRLLFRRSALPDRTSPYWTLPVWGAVLISVAGLALGWVVYDQLCKSKLGDNDTLLFAVLFVFLLVLAFAYTFVFSGRGAMMQMGALVGTMMVANVAMVIIPNQRVVVADLIAGKQPDPKLGAAAKQRSLHNNYLTLPVIFVMIANHYPLAFATRWNWLIFGLVLVIGAVIRHFYNSRHKGLPSPWWTWAVAAAGMIAIILLSMAGPPVGAVEEAAAAPPSR